MDARTTRGLVLLTVVSLFCAGVMWAHGRDLFGSVFSALGTVAVLGAVHSHRR